MEVDFHASRTFLLGKINRVKIKDSLASLNQTWGLCFADTVDSGAVFKSLTCAVFGIISIVWILYLYEITSDQSGLVLSLSVLHCSIICPEF